MSEGPKEWIPVIRPSEGTAGCIVNLLSNHIKTTITGTDANFYCYNVLIKYNNNNKQVDYKGMKHKVLEKFFEQYGQQLSVSHFAFDGRKALFTTTLLSIDVSDLIVEIGEASTTSKTVQQNDKAFKVSLDYVDTIALDSIAKSLQEIDHRHMKSVFQIFNTIIRQQQAKRGCLLVGPSFYYDDPDNFEGLGRGVTGCRGFHTTFQTTEDGMSLKIGTAATTTVTECSVINFLLLNQNVDNLNRIDWMKAKNLLLNMKIKTSHNDMEFRVVGMSALPCKRQSFTLKVLENDERKERKLTICKYFQQCYNIELSQSADFPCLDVGRPNHPKYLPLEVCTIMPFQLYTKALSSQQRDKMANVPRQLPQARAKAITKAIGSTQFDEHPLFKALGLHIENQLGTCLGRVLTAPTLIMGDKEFVPEDGKWNFYRKKLKRPVKIVNWVICNFSSRHKMNDVLTHIIKSGCNIGIRIGQPIAVVEEHRKWMRDDPLVRVERMYENIKKKMRERNCSSLQFVLCVLPNKKSDIYGPWKNICHHKEGIVTQCISPKFLSETYFTSVLLKINVKLGGVNYSVSEESIPIINKCPTLILGLDIWHGDRPDLPSIAAVVGSRSWPSISTYRAFVRTQAHGSEIVHNLFDKRDGKDYGMIRGVLLEFYYSTTPNKKPEQIIIFRDGVDDSQFKEVVDVELAQIKEAYEFLGSRAVDPIPKFALIIAQKRSTTRFFTTRFDNVPPGTVIDSGVVHPRNHDFYMCPHKALEGTTRPTHYHVLVDEIGFSADDIQNLVYSLSYECQRSTSAISVVAPVYYADLAAYNMSHFLEANPGGIAGLRNLHADVSRTMYFC